MPKKTFIYILLPYNKKKQKKTHTSWEGIGSDKLFEKFIGTGDFVEVVCVGRKPEFEHSAFLKTKRYKSSRIHTT